MILRAIAFTEKGQSWSVPLGIPVDRGVPVMEWAKAHFDEADALLFIGAAGIFGSSFPCSRCSRISGRSDREACSVPGRTCTRPPAE